MSFMGSMLYNLLRSKIKFERSRQQKTIAKEFMLAYEYDKYNCEIEKLEVEKKEGKFDLFDIYVQFDKTFDFYLKYGQKNNMVEDFNYHFNCFNKYLRMTGLNFDIEKIKNNEREMGVVQDFWKKIVYLNERVLQNLMKETDAGQLNYLFIDIAKQMLDIFIQEIYQPKFYKIKNDLADYFNINEDFFSLLLDTFDAFVIKNVKVDL